MDGFSNQTKFNKAQVPPRRTHDLDRLDHPWSKPEEPVEIKPKLDPKKVVWLKWIILIAGVFVALLVGAVLFCLINLASNPPPYDNKDLDAAASGLR